LLERWDAGAVLISRGEEGMALFKRTARGGVAMREFPTLARETFDVTGAGDTVIAACALALGAGGTLEEATGLAHHAARPRGAPAAANGRPRPARGGRAPRAPPPRGLGGGPKRDGEAGRGGRGRERQARRRPTRRRLSSAAGGRSEHAALARAPRAAAGGHL